MIIFSTVYAFADSPNSEYIQKQKRFITELFGSKMYFNCISETRRLMQYKKNKKYKNDYEYFIASNYFLGKQYKSVIFNIIKNKKLLSENKFIILLSQSYLKLGYYKESIKALDKIQYNNLTNIDIYNIFYRRCEIHLYSKSYNSIYDEIEEVKKYYKDQYSLGKFEKDITKYKGKGFRSTTVSIGLSMIIPGTGQIYSGKYWQGVLTFVSVAATAVGAYFSYINNYKDISYTLIFFSAAFYIGNIYGAYNSARSANMNSHKRFRSRITNKYIPEYNPSTEINLERL